MKSVKASLSITGAIWQLKGKPDALADLSIEGELHKERLTTHFNGQGTGTVFEPNRVSVQTEGGRLVDSRDDPRSAFRGQTRQTPWDDLHVAYFSGYALWNYLTIKNQPSPSPQRIAAEVSELAMLRVVAARALPCSRINR
jgi:hypothetical protein